MSGEEFLDVLRNIRPSLLVVTAAFAVALAFGLAAPPEVGTEQIEALAETIGLVAEAGPLAMLALIIVNNVVKAFAFMALGIVLGVPPLLFVVVNGYIIGAVVTAIEPELGTGVVIASLVPHGIIEIPAMLLASGLGLWVGLGVLRRFAGRPGAGLARLRVAGRTYLVWVLPALLIAAAIEVFVTPLVIHAFANGASAFP